MSMLDKNPKSRPYIVELTSPDGTKMEVKVDAYDACEAIIAAVCRADAESGDGPERKVTSIKPDVDRLREVAMETSMVRRIVEGVGRVEPKKGKEGEQRKEQEERKAQ